MSTLRVLFAIMRTGYFNKIRTYRFIVILILVIIAGYIFVPAVDADYVTLGWGTDTAFYRGVYNSAWIGSLVAMLTALFLTLTGFYIINDTIKNDEQTHVGEIIATTPVKNSVYTLGTALSNFAVLSTMVVVVFFTTLGMQLLRGEYLTIDLWALMAPFLVFVLPLMFLVGAIAVFFETRPSLRGGFGNIMYFFVWLIGIPLSSESFDLFGINTTHSSMLNAGLAEYPDLDQYSYILGFSWGFPEGRTLTTFTWEGIQFTVDILQTRLLLIVIAIAFALIASIRFSRFDPAFCTEKIPEYSSMVIPDVKEAQPTSVIPLKEVHLEPLEASALQFRFVPVLIAECRLIIKEFEELPFLGKGGFGAVIAFVFVGLLLPVDVARTIILPIAWLFPVLVWSKMGTRESQHRTSQLIYSSANILRRQLPALWLAGVFLTMFAGSGVALNLGLHGDLFGLCAWTAGSFFIPSLALCMGVWTNSSKLFEFVYTMLWYIGPISQIEVLDFMGALPGSIESGIWLWYSVFTLILIGLSFIGRKMQIRSV